MVWSLLISLFSCYYARLIVESRSDYMLNVASISSFSSSSLVKICTPRFSTWINGLRFYFLISLLTSLRSFADTALSSQLRTLIAFIYFRV